MISPRASARCWSTRTGDRAGATPASTTVPAAEVAACMAPLPAGELRFDWHGV